MQWLAREQVPEARLESNSADPIVAADKGRVTEAFMDQGIGWLTFLSECSRAEEKRESDER